MAGCQITLLQSIIVCPSGLPLDGIDIIEIQAGFDSTIVILE